MRLNIEKIKNKIEKLTGNRPTQIELAKLLNVTQPTISNYSRGGEAQGLELLLKIEEITETKIDDLIL